MQLTPTIGLEIHAELKTATKMFCSCRNDPDEERANWHVCPVCMGHPGTLPVINGRAVEYVLRVGSALGGELADYSEFDRKNYFYPDIPKNYQISQYKYPFVARGRLNGVTVTRVHLEEDTARSVHTDEGTRVDFNRAGVPLMELVTEPEIHTEEDAVSFARELRNTLRYLDVSDANLEKGEMRVEANISVGAEGKLGTKVEVKNLNSFKAVESAIRYEVKRQSECVAKGEKVAQETRGWDETRQKTFSQRSKEDSHDYRYFPEPDLPKILRSGVEGWQETALTATLPELPWKRRERYRMELGIAPSAVETLVQDMELGSFFEKVCAVLQPSGWKVAANYITSDLLGIVNSPNYKGTQLVNLDANQFAELVTLVETGVLSSRGAKDVLAKWLLEGGSPKAIGENNNLLQSSDEGEITSIVLDILSSHASVVDECRSGKESALQYLVGQAMKASKGRANPTLLQKIVRAQIFGEGSK